MRSSLIKALPILAKALSEDYGVSLEIQGSQAMTDGRRIVLPVLPEDDRRAAILARGYLDHEAGHVKHTDFSVQRGTGMEAVLANILEDIRVEQAMARRYPGCRENLEVLVRLLVDEGELKPPQPTDPPAMVVQSLVFHLLRTKVLGQQVLAPFVGQARVVFDEKFPGLRPQVEAIALEVRKARDTGQVVDLARRIADIFRAAAPPPAAPQQGGGQDSGAPGSSPSGKPQTVSTEPPDGDDSHSPDQHGSTRTEDEAGAAASGQAPAGAEPQQAQGNHDPGCASSEPGMAAEDGSAAETESLDTASTPSGCDEDDAPGTDGTGEAGGDGPGAGKSVGQAQADTAQPQEKGNRDPGCPAAQADGSGPKQTPDEVASAAAAALADEADYLDLGQAAADKLGEVSQQDGPALAREVKPWWGGKPIDEKALLQATARLRAMLAGVVQAKRARKERPSRWGTRLDLRGLAKLAVNDGRVFLARQERQAVNTAVYLLLDQSGSMSHPLERPRIKTAFLALAALVKGLASVPGTAVAAGSFTTSYGDPVVVELLDFTETDRRFCLAEPPPSGTTPLAEAIYCVAPKLLRRPEPRKMLVVMTDGMPDVQQKAQEAIARCRAGGIEVYGVGIQVSHVESLFGNENAVVVQQLQDLPEKLFRLLAKRL